MILNWRVMGNGELVCYLNSFVNTVCVSVLNSNKISHREKVNLHILL